MVSASAPTNGAPEDLASAVLWDGELMGFGPWGFSERHLMAVLTAPEDSRAVLSSLQRFVSLALESFWHAVKGDFDR
jgi:hypothetical protein